VAGSISKPFLNVAASKLARDSELNSRARTRAINFIVNDFCN